MNVDLDQTNIDPYAPEWKPLLDNLQCNILKSHGRDYTAHIFLKFTGAEDEARAWIRDLANRYLISTTQQVEQAKNFSENHIPGGLVGCFFLAAPGYRFLGLDTDLFHDKNKTFQKGMKHRDFDPLGQLLDKNNKDPDPKAWEPEYQQEIHAMLLLAVDAPEDALDTTPAVLRAAVKATLDTVHPFATVLTVEWGNVLRNEQPKAVGKNEPERKGQPIEHFGYVDGRSNPVFLQGDIKKETSTSQWNPSAPLSLVIVPDPYANGEDSFGSYFVFRKLEQNVAGFHLAVASLASQLNMMPDLAGAMAVGRFKDGTPLTLQPADGLGDVNDFGYENADSPGNRCPAHAHIRKVNPRGTTPFTSLDDERRRRIVRRGIPYGARNIENPPRSGVGLLFMCYQSDIHLQWEFIQRTWADNPNFPKHLILPGTGDDPLIGQDSDASAAQKWPTDWDQDDRKRSGFGGYVTLMGGEFFFAPSLRFLRNL